MDTLPTVGGDDDGDADGDDDDDDDVSSCDTLPPRQLRLLTRAEYEATVADLFGLEPRTTCESDAHCPAGASCEAPACIVEHVPLTSFNLPADGQTWGTVHVAGTFNDWTGSVGDGVWALSYDADADAWTGSFALPTGTHQYKFVIDEATWITDPGNPDTAPDGVGGDNSVLDVVAQTETVDPLSLGLGSELPAESRPAGYPFDNNAEAGLVSATHVEAYMRAAHDVSLLAMDTADAWMPCDPAGDSGCAETFATEVGLHVFRRPLDADEVGKYAAIAEADGADVALEAMLASPLFLYRSEIGEPDGDHVRLTGYEVAAALSYTLLGTTPDTALLQAATDGTLDGAEGVEAQARRLLDDPRARDRFGLFAVQWLGVEQIQTVDKNAMLFGDVDAPLRAAMLEETQRFVGHVAFQGSGSYAELLTADYSFIDDRLAALYDAEAPGSTELQQTTLPSNRAGLLGHASILGSYAYSDQSSPVRRGLFVRRQILCQELPDPPPDAGGVPEVDPDATTRERFEQHSSDPACSGCHTFIDPVGFGFENFDAIGAWRDTDGGKPVDASGVARDIDGVDPADEEFEGIVELGALLANSNEAPRCLAQQYFRYAHGRLETADDACAVDQLAERFAEADHDLVELLVATLTSPELRYRQ